MAEAWELVKEVSPALALVMSLVAMTYRHEWRLCASQLKRCDLARIRRIGVK